MWRAAFFFFLALFAPFTATSALAAKGEKWIGFQLGRSFSTGGFGNPARTGLDFGISGTSMGTDRLGIGGDVILHPWSPGARPVILAPSAPESRSTSLATQVSLHVLYDFRTHGTTRPYVRAGYGFYAVESPFGFLGLFSRFVPTYNLGAGVSYHGIGFSGMYHVVHSEDGPDAKLVTAAVSILWGRPTR